MSSLLTSGTLTLSKFVELVLMFTFFCLLVLNIVAMFKWAKDRNSMFIMVSLFLLDILRLITFYAAYFYTTYFFGSELLIRLGHDLPSCVFDCMTIALFFQFMWTYDVLDDHNKAVQKMERNFYKRFEGTMFFVYGGLVVFDIVSLAIAERNQFQGQVQLSNTAEMLLCAMDSVVLLMYLVLFCQFRLLFRRLQLE